MINMVGVLMSKELIEKLSKLKLTEATLKRALDVGFSREDKQKIFREIDDIKKEIELTKFKLKMEKELGK